MGFRIGNPYVASLLNGIEREILDSLGRAAAAVENGTADAQCTKWFGDSPDAFKKRLGRTLRKMKTVVNLRAIPVSYTPLAEHNRSTNADALTQTEMLLEFNNTTEVDVRLNVHFASLPRYVVRGADGIDTSSDQQSQFETIVHELSHGLLATIDVKRGGQTAYGASAAHDLARNSPSNAKQNAENWGFFVEEFLR